MVAPTPAASSVFCIFVLDANQPLWSRGDFILSCTISKLQKGRLSAASIPLRLTEVAAEAAELDEPELVATLRQLVQAVIVHAPPGTDELAIEIKASYRN